MDWDWALEGVQQFELHKNFEKLLKYNPFSQKNAASRKPSFGLQENRNIAFAFLNLTKGKFTPQYQLLDKFDGSEKNMVMVCRQNATQKSLIIGGRNWDSLPEIHIGSPVLKFYHIAIEMCPIYTYIIITGAIIT